VDRIQPQAVTAAHGGPLDRFTDSQRDAIMSTSTTVTTASTGDDEWEDALRAATAFIAGFRSPDTRKGYRRDLRCWLEFCAAHDLHPYVRVRRTHVEVYLRQLEQQVPALATRRCGGGSPQLSSWFT
jgi:hypothetical protein